MQNINLNSPHRRYNQLNGEWVLVSPHRTKRPWQGKEELSNNFESAGYDENCYLCPRNERAGGKINPDYTKTFVFTNDFAALLPEISESYKNDDSLFKVESVKGTSRVICFSPNHSHTIPRMQEKDILQVINVWCDQIEELGKKYLWVQIFENKGDIMGCSNPHPHGQIWAGSFLPNEPFKEDKNQKKYFHENNSILLVDYLDKELKQKDRIVIENDHWVVLVPFWAIWPFETILFPKRHIQRLTDLNENEKVSLSEILKKFLTKYDNLFNISFPYTMGWHGAPFNNQDNKHWQLHAHFYPPLLRSASVKKFMVGYEMLAEAQRDITPEQAAERIRNSSHYYESNF